MLTTIGAAVVVDDRFEGVRLSAGRAGSLLVHCHILHAKKQSVKIRKHILVSDGEFVTYNIYFNESSPQQLLCSTATNF